jgi:ornithine--oxo-acid transaminase
MTTNTYMEKENRYCAHNYHPLPVVIKKGLGTKLWDTDGNEYLDFMSAYSAVSMGHANPRLVKVMTEQASELTITSRAFYTDKLGAFMEKLCGITGMDMALPMNTGAEAVETAIKAARRWGYRVKGIAKDKAEIIVAEGNFHGRTTTIVGFSSDEEYKDGFGPFDGGFKCISYGDADALRAAITPNTAAFLVEPIQGEAGIVMPPKGWLKEVQAICKENNVLLILDEIQTGMARTGKNFCFQHEIDKPDGLLLGKALGGGLFPVSAFVAKKEVMDMFDYGSHGSTWGGNPLACAIGMEALAIMKEEKLAEKSWELGNYLMDKLRGLNSEFISGVRGSGLFIALDIDPAKATAREVCERLMAKGVLSKETHATVVRFAPPLIITKAEIDWAFEQVNEVLAEMGKAKAAA